MKDFYTALQHCLNAIDLGIDLESCLSLYPEYEAELRQFFQKWNGARDYINGLSPASLEQVLFDQALDECIKAVGRGESPEECYKRYPAYARKMKPWLKAVSELPRLRRDGILQTNDITFDEFFVPDVPFTQALEEYIQAYKKRESNVVLARYPYYADRLQFWADKIPDQPELLPPTPRQQLASKRIPARLGSLFAIPSLQFPVAIALALLVFMFSGMGLARAAAATVPGQTLYPLKLIAEQIQLNIVPNEQKAELQEQYAAERRRETSALIHADIKQDVAFDGQVTAVEKDKVTVSGVVLVLDGFNGRLPVVDRGASVHIEGYTGRNGVVVKKIDVRMPNGSQQTFVAPTPVPVTSITNSLNSTPLSIVEKAPTPIPGPIIIAVPPTTAASDGRDENSGSASSSSSAEPVIVVAPTSSIPIYVPPTSAPTAAPTTAPTDVPQPTAAPTSPPPTAQPPTAQPTAAPTSEPTAAPTDNPPPPEPTAAPTDNPPPQPTSAPTDSPPQDPTSSPASIQP